MRFAIPGAVGGFVYWLCVRRHLPLSPKIGYLITLRKDPRTGKRVSRLNPEA
jgi:hypothetical protein